MVMAILTPNETYTVNGVTVNEKIIPDGTRWKSASKAAAAGFSVNSLYKKECMLTQNTGKPKSVTIHNSSDIAKVEDDAEQFSRATYNENMGSQRVHFYIDDLGAWQLLKAGTGLCKNDPEGSAEVSWHAGDGSTPDGGNMTSISLEIVMNDTSDHDRKARDNGARIAAWMLWKHHLTIDALVTHTFWVNKAAGNYFENPDEQSTNPVPNKKWCPSYIFGSNNRTVALTNWKAFKAIVKEYLDTLSGKNTSAAEKEKPTVEVGDLVRIVEGATYYSGKKIPGWVKKLSWYVRILKGDRAVIDKDKDGLYAICSPVNISFLEVVCKAGTEKEESAFRPYLVRITADALNIRKGPGTDMPRVGKITDRGVYTIVAESTGKGASLWGKLKSGAGWISLDYTEKR